MGSIQKSHSEAEPLASLLSAPDFQRWLRSQRKENELAEKDSEHFCLVWEEETTP